MWRRTASRFIIIAAALLFSSGRPRLGLALPAEPQALDAAELCRRIDAAQRDLFSLSAEFVQISRVKLFKQELRSTGRFLYQRTPDPSTAPPAVSPAASSTTPVAGAAKAMSSLRWEYFSPDPSTMLIVGDRATLRMGNLAPRVFDIASDPSLRAIFTQLRLWLGQGALAEAGGEYEMKSGGDRAHPALILFPRPASVLKKTFARVELHVDAKSMQLVRLLLVEESGDEKEIIFSGMRRNIALPKNAFAL